jgi:cysteinyl-tRNA synthetase
MSMDLLGPSFDLHLGGEDLAFPHHEDEIAQSEGAGVQHPGRPFVKHWMHGSHLLVEGRKMSKSLGNYFTVRDLITKGYTGREIRFLLLSAHYRETFNFTLAGLDGARTALARLDECIGKLTELAAGANSPASGDGLVERFTSAMDNDLNVSLAWGSVFDWVRDNNRALAAATLTPAQAASELTAWNRVNEVFGITVALGADVPAEISALAEARVAAKKAKDFARADAIRGELKTLGWIVEDTAKGPKLKQL